MNALKRLLGAALVALLILTAPGLPFYQALAADIADSDAAAAASGHGIIGVPAPAEIRVPADPVGALGQGGSIDANIGRALRQDAPAPFVGQNSAATPEAAGLHSQASNPSDELESAAATQNPDASAAQVVSVAAPAPVWARRAALQGAVARLKRFFGAAATVSDTGNDDVYSEEQRPPRLIARDGEGRFTIANVRWGRKDADTHLWDSAQIDPRAVEDIYWGNIETGVGHSFLMFRFKEGGFRSTREGAQPTKSLAISVEARMKKGQTYDPIAGEFGAYPAQVWNLYTLEDFTQNTLGELGRPLALYPFHLSALQKETLAVLALSKALLDHGADPYNTLGNNCATNSLELYNAVVSAAQRVRGFLLALPALATRAVVKAGAVGPKIPFTPQDPTGGGLINPPPAR